MRFQLGEWAVDEKANLLIRGDQQVRLEKRVMAVLMQLIAARGAVVSKDALIDEVWNGAIVSDHSVANTISELRRALGDDRCNPRYIETISKRGYRLIAEADQISATGIAAASIARQIPVQTRLAAIAIVLVGAVMAIVLMRGWISPTDEVPPRVFLANIENATGDARWDIVGNTASEMLTVMLAGGDYRLVRWRTGSPVDLRADSPLVQDMNTTDRDRVIQGRIVADGDTAVLLLQVIDAADGASIWGGSYPLQAGRFADTSQAVAADLRQSLGLGAHIEDFPNVSADDLEAYWRARYLWSLREHDSIREALRILTEVTERSPGFARAHAALADIYAHKTAEELALERQTTFDLAELHLERALSLDPYLADVFITRAYLSFFRDRDAATAMTQIDEAIALDPQNAVAWQTKAMIASAAGQVDTSLSAIDEAQALDSLSASILWDKVWFLYIAGRYDDALKTAAFARRFAPPVDVYEALVHLARNDLPAAIESWLVRAQMRGLSARRAAMIEEISHEQGVRAGLEALAAEASGANGYVEHPVPLAALLVALERTDEAIALLAGAKLQEKSWWWSWYDVIPTFKEIRSDSRLASIAIKKVSASN